MTGNPAALGSNPYPGLRPFDEEDAPLFFGRKDQTYDLLRRLEEHRFVAVVGASGSGKSSLVRAGLIPALRRGYLTEGGQGWRIAGLRPGADPIDQLARALDSALRPEPARLETLRRSSFGLIRAAREGRSPDENLLVLVDQFEEIFRHPRQESSDFVRLLLTALQEAQPDYRIYVVLTMRTDYLGDCAQFRDLPEALNDSLYLVPRLTQERRREAFEKPAKELAGQIDSQLLQQLMLDAGDDPDQLPILQHLLMRLWTLASGTDDRPAGTRRITLEHYHDAGGWKNALDNHGRDLLDSLPPAHRPVAKRIFQRVTELGGRDRDRRRLTHLSELCEVCAPMATEVEVKSIVAHFSRPGSDFLTSPDWQTALDPLIDITHESLIRQWTELNSWAREEAECGAWYQRLEDRVNTGGTLLAGAELESALKAREDGHWTDAWATRHTTGRAPFGKVIEFLDESGKRRAKELSAYALESLADDPERSVFLGIQAVNATLRSAQPVVPAAEDALRRAILSSQVRMTLRGHSNNVLSVAYSPDGKRIATSSDDHTVKVWDAATGQELLTLRGHSNSVETVTFDPDGQRIATASDDHIAKVWDAVTGQELLTLRGHADRVMGVAFCPTGKRIATASWDRTAKVWDSATGRELLTLRGHSNFIESVAYSQDGSYLATASDDNTAKVWDPASGKALLTLGDHLRSVKSVVFSPDSNILATASHDGTAKVWDAATGQNLLTLRGHSDVVESVAFSPDGRRLATAGDDGTARVWDVAGGHVLLILRGHAGSVESLAFSPDGSRLATASWDRTAKVWETFGGHELLALRGHSSAVEKVVFSPDGHRLATASLDHTAKVWGARDGQELLTIDGFSEPVESVAFSPDGRCLAAAIGDATVKVWDAANGDELDTLKGHASVVWRVAYSPDGDRLATASLDETVKVWDAQWGKELLTLRGHSNSVECVAFSPDGRRLATASQDKTAKLWDAASGQELLTLRGHSDIVWSVAFSPDGKSLATSSRDKTAKVWDAATGRELLALRGHGDSVPCVVFSSNAERIATASLDETAKVWDAETGQELLTLRGHSTSVYGVAFSPDGKRLATSGEDGVVQIYALDIHDLLTLAKQRVTRHLTTEECLRYFQTSTCPALDLTSGTGQINN